MCVSVAMVTRFTRQQNNTQSRIGPRNLCTKYELHRASIAGLDVIHDPRSIDSIDSTHPSSGPGPRPD